MHVQLPIKVCTAHIHYNPNKTVFPMGSIIEARPFSYLHSVRHHRVQYLIICLLLLYIQQHIGMCIAEAYFTLGYATPTVPFLLSLKFGSGLFFITFLTITHFIKYFGIIRKANITSNVFKITIMIIIIMKHSLTYQRKKERPSLFKFSFLSIWYIRKCFIN